MKLILNSDVAKLGRKGDIVDVAKGYARNYLLPKNLAIVATDSNILIAEKIQEKRIAEISESEELAESMEHFRSRYLREVANAAQDDDARRAAHRLQLLAGSGMTEACGLVSKARTRAQDKIIKNEVSISACIIGIPPAFTKQ